MTKAKTWREDAVAPSGNRVIAIAVPTRLGLSLSVGKGDSLMSFLVLSAALTAVGTAAHAADIRLTCGGMASQLQVATTYGSLFGDVDVGGSATNYRIGQTPDRLLVEISESGGRIRPPKVILPPLRGKGAGDGWWRIENLVVGETEITGKFRLNVMNNPTIRIDRTTGSIEVHGYAYTRFVGTCEVANPAERKF